MCARGKILKYAFNHLNAVTPLCADPPVHESRIEVHWRMISLPTMHLNPFIVSIFNGALATQLFEHCLFGTVAPSNQCHPL